MMDTARIRQLAGLNEAKDKGRLPTVDEIKPKIVSVHATQEEAQKAADKLNREKEKSYKPSSYTVSCIVHEVEASKL